MNTDGVGVVGCRTPFTAAQWQELEHQALIFKYMMAGIPVPPELVLPIHRSFEAMATRFYHHPTLGYCCYYGKKLDPELGRCRRTDGKKWRCSKDAYPDSKYCERHMHRGRNRSRKPVEMHPLSPSQSPTSTVTSLAPAGSIGNNGSRISSGTHPSIPLASLVGESNPQGSYAGEAGPSQLHLDPGSYGMATKDFRYLQGVKAEVDEHSFFSETSGNVRGLGKDSLLENTMCLMPSGVSSYALSTARNASVVQSRYPQLQSLQHFGQGTINSLPKQQHSFIGNEFGLPETAKHETQSLHPFFDEWPKTRDSWSELDEDRANHTSFSTTRLSISIPMESSDFSTTSSRSPNGEPQILTHPLTH